VDEDFLTSNNMQNWNKRYIALNRTENLKKIRQKSLLLKKSDFSDLRLRIIKEAEIQESKLTISNLKNQLRNDYFDFQYKKSKTRVKKQFYRNNIFESFIDDEDAFDQEDDLLPLEFEFDEDRFYTSRQFVFFIT